MMKVHVDSAETQKLLSSVRDGDTAARSELLRRHDDVIRRSIGRRLDVKTRSRFDLSDVIQETQLDVIRRLDEYLENRPMPFSLWLLKLTHQRLVKLEREHLATDKRSVIREMPLPDRSSMNLAKHLVSKEPLPDQKIHQQELARRVRRAVASLAETDREILMLRNFEQLSNKEAAQLLELNPESTKKRYTRALVKLQTVLTANSDFGDGRLS